MKETEREREEERNTKEFVMKPKCCHFRRTLCNREGILSCKLNHQKFQDETVVGLRLTTTMMVLVVSDALNAL